MTELEAYILREEEELGRCLTQIEMLEKGRTPIPKNEDLKQVMLAHENRKRELLEKHIETMKEHAARA